MQGERRSKRRGQSVEFADYRPYVVGDDLRFIDWNLYARLEKLFLRLFMEEEDLCVSILVDVTQSMDYGDPNKLLFAKRIAAALGYIGLSHYNRLTIASIADTIDHQLPNLRGRRPIPQMLDFVAGLAPVRGTGNLAESLRRFALTHRQKGVIVVISDFLDKGDLFESLRYLAGDAHDVYILQLLCPQEIDPRKGNLAGDLRITDVEDHQAAEVSITPALLKRYRLAVEQFCNDVRHTCLKRGMAYLFADTSAPFEDVVLRYLRERGLLG
jgi:uncharacterized protein (DUF58 family)